MRTTTMDPLCEKYYSISPYAWCGNNPVNYIDPNGREITITGNDGKSVTYTLGIEYDGDDDFVKDMWRKLDQMYTVKSGRMVLDPLIADKEKAFNLSNQVAVDGKGNPVLSYLTNGSRLFKMGGIADIPIEAFAHEMFHAYQDFNGYGGASCANDVEAYLYQAIIFGELNNSEPPFGVNYGAPNENASSEYKIAYFSIFDGPPSINTLDVLSIGFKTNTRAGEIGVAKEYSTFSPQQQYLILKFWP